MSRVYSKAMVPHHFVITDLFEILMILLRKELRWWSREAKILCSQRRGLGFDPWPGNW